MIRLFLQSLRHIRLEARSTVAEMAKSYEEAVRTLNTLQSNAAKLAKTREERDRNRHLGIPATRVAAAVVGITPERLDELSVIHVSGTKGKGSTCALCESVLRAHGYTTGFFSSPHLVEVRERIRVNGRPISKDAFSTYFWECYHKLDAARGDPGFEMPFYFRFLTIMAFHVFLQEKVDVAIVEVGIGGQYDCTNILRSPVVCGVSSLGIDHTTILGNTLDQIAWHKAGIFKPGVPALTISQPENSIEVLKSRAQEIGCPLSIVPELDQYDWGAQSVALGIPGPMQDVNASLAIQLAHVWMKDHTLDKSERWKKYKAFSHEASCDADVPVSHFLRAQTFPITDATRTGLEQCQWAGRSQQLKKPGLTYYIDGAHTGRSMEACVTWFYGVAEEEADAVSGRVARVLLFNMSGDRCAQELLEKLVPCGFDCAVFCPNIASVSSGRADQMNLTITVDSVLAKCIKNKNVWLRVLSQGPSAKSAFPLSTRTTESQTNNNIPAKTQIRETSPVKDSLKRARFSADSGLDVDSGFESCESVNSSPERDVMPSYVFNTIQDALTWLSLGRDPALTGVGRPMVTAPSVLQEADHIQVLCTGSLHLVGGVLGLIHPDMND